MYAIEVKREKVNFNNQPNIYNFLEFKVNRDLLFLHYEKKNKVNQKN